MCLTVQYPLFAELSVLQALNIMPFVFGSVIVSNCSFKDWLLESNPVIFSLTVN